MEINHFIKNRIKEDIATGKTRKVIVRFPPEPNGYLHLGHVKSIILNSSLAEEFEGELNLRFDDTNPEKETEEYVRSIKYDTHWLTNRFTRILWASDYFDTLYECAVHLIKKGLAYVDDSSLEDIRSMRGDFNHAGHESIYRNRSIEDNLKLFTEMKNGRFADGTKVLRAKIDMSHSNLNMRDPVLYRIRHVEHHNTGTKWCIYPMYDYAHPLSDAIEGVTHSICTLEFEDHRPLYDWCVDNCFDLLGAKPEQIEFARLDMEGILLSKRKLNRLVSEGYVSGWDSPVMPTISGLRNRGFTADILKDFILRSGFSKANSTIEKSVLDDCIRDNLSPVSDRKMAIITPVELEIENWNMTETIFMPNHPKDKTRGERELHLTRHLWVEESDIRLEAEKDFWRIYPGNWVRLKHGYNLFIKEVKSENGKPVKVVAELDYDSKNPKTAKHKAKAALHWLSSEDSIDMICYFYNTLCDSDGNYLDNAIENKYIKVEKTMADISEGRFEFERNGYFYINHGAIHCMAYLKK